MTLAATLRLNFKFIISLMTAAFLTACQSSSRDPAAVLNKESLVEYYNLKADLGHVSDQISENKKDSSEKNNLILKKDKITEDVNQKYPALAAEMTTDVPVMVSIPFNKSWRRHHDELIIHELDSYVLSAGSIKKKMFLSTDTTQNLYLQLTHFIYSWKSLKENPQWIPSVENDQAFLNAELICSHDAIIHDSPRKIKAPAGKQTSFKWFDKKLNGQRAFIEIKDHNTTCDLKFSIEGQPEKYGIQLIPESQELARIGSPHLQSEICYLPSTQNLGKIQQFFLDADLKYTTCPVRVEKYQTLEESEEGINAKIRILTGKSLTREFLRSSDPFAPLDLSQAPKLDAILISYLVFRADFGGSVIMQALRHHAKQGTLIRIALSDVITLGKDRQMLLDFQSEFPNVKLLFYKYRPQGKGFKDWLSSFHRTNHIKLFLTYSKSEPLANQVILGGRNIHDGFVFDQPSANYIYPTLIDYSADGDETWARWEDFETLFTSSSLVKAIMGQFFSVLHADYATIHFRNFTENIQVDQPLSEEYLKLKDQEVLIRSMVSVPFKDDHRLEKLFIQMIDSAEQVIKVSTPYFNLTAGLLKAFQRAAERGVEVQLITRLDLEGDTADLVLSDVNKKSINKIYKKIKVYEYTTKGKILHSKLFLIDHKFVMMGSVNLNLRSFIHDIENATLVYGPEFNKKIDQLYETYKSESKLLTEKQKTSFWKGILIKIIGTAL